MEEKNPVQPHPQDGNQVNIGSNSGTINITNSSDSDLLKQVVKSQNDFNGQLAHFVKILDESIKKTMEMVKESESKKRSKK